MLAAFRLRFSRGVPDPVSLHDGSPTEPFVEYVYTEKKEDMPTYCDNVLAHSRTARRT